MNLDRMRRYRRRTMTRPDHSRTLTLAELDDEAAYLASVTEFRGQVAAWVDAQGIHRDQVSWGIQNNPDGTVTVSWWVGE
jgi:hypothetical protein